MDFTSEQQLELEAKHLPWGVPYSGKLPANLTLLHHLDHVTGEFLHLSTNCNY